MGQSVSSLALILAFSWQVVKNGLEKGQLEGYRKEAEVCNQLHAVWAHTCNGHQSAHSCYRLPS